MKKISMFSALVTSGCFLLFSSCNKDDDEFANPFMKCQVAEYHLSTYDLYFTDFPFLFKKTYDRTGKILKEISCLFWNDEPPTGPYMTPHDLVIKNYGRKIFLMNKHNLLDTVVKIILNIKGRVESCETTAGLNDAYANQYGDIEHFQYKNNRVVALLTTIVNHGTTFTNTTPIIYDNYGNFLSSGGGTFQYDYSRKAKKQFYCDDLMGHDGFYLLQYLGFFPEINSPVNLRKHGEAATIHGDFTNHTFDAEGKLTGYYFAGIKASITWNCKGGSLNNYINAGFE